MVVGYKALADFMATITRDSTMGLSPSKSPGIKFGNLFLYFQFIIFLITNKFLK